MIDKLKKRVEAYVFVVGILGYLMWSGTGIKDDLAGNADSIKDLTKAQQRMLDEAAETMDEKLNPIREDLKEVKTELNVQKSDINSISIATTQGAEAQTRLLAGKITDLQQRMVQLHDQQEFFVVAVDTIRLQMSDIRSELDARPDTLIVFAPGDTVFIEKRTPLWKKIVPGF